MVLPGSVVRRELVLWMISAAVGACKGNLIQVLGGPRRCRQSTELWVRVFLSLGASAEHAFGAPCS